MTLFQFPGILPQTIFNDMFDVYDFQKSFHQSRDYPIYDMYEKKDGGIILEFALAGYSISDIKVEHVGSQLEISANKAKDRDLKGTRRISKRAFTQVFTDTHGKFDFDKSSIVFKDGILTIDIPLNKKNAKKLLPVSSD